MRQIDNKDNETKIRNLNKLSELFTNTHFVRDGLTMSYEIFFVNFWTRNVDTRKFENGQNKTKKICQKIY